MNIIKLIIIGSLVFSSHLGFAKDKKQKFYDLIKDIREELNEEEHSKEQVLKSHKNLNKAYLLLADEYGDGDGAAPVLTISDGPTFDFGLYPVGAVVEKLFIISYAGHDDATSVLGHGLSGDFQYSGGAYPGFGGTCGTVLNSSNTPCTINVKYSPSHVGAAIDQILINYFDGFSQQQVARSIVGFGATAAQLEIVGGESYDFGLVLATQNALQTFTLKNNGEFIANNLSGSGLSGDYSFDGGAFPGVGGTCGVTLYSRATCKFVVRYSPGETGRDLTSLNIGFYDGVTYNSVGKILLGQGFDSRDVELSLNDPKFSPGNDSTPEIKVSQLVGGLDVMLFTDNRCLQRVAQGTSVGSELNLTSLDLEYNGTYDFHVAIGDSVGNKLCESASVEYELDILAPQEPIGWTMSSPISGSISNDTTPVISGSRLIGESGSRVMIYEDSACSELIASSLIVKDKFSVHLKRYRADGSDDGFHSYYGKVTDTLGNESSCANLNLHYTLDTLAPSQIKEIKLSELYTVNRTESPLISWFNSRSKDMSHYEVGLSSYSSGGNDVAGWNSIPIITQPGRASGYKFTGLSLVDCAEYYPSVRSVDLAGNTTAPVIASVPFISDRTAPNPISNLQITASSYRNKSPEYKWGQLSDNCGVASVQIAMGTEENNQSLLRWKNIDSNLNSYSVDGLELAIDTNYWTYFRVIDGAGNKSQIIKSGPWQKNETKDNLPSLIVWLDGSDKSSIYDEEGVAAQDINFSGQVAIWKDKSKSIYEHNFYSLGEGKQPLLKNNMIVLDGIKNQIGPENHSELNTSDVNQRNISVGFKTSFDTVSRQAIWESGSASRGMNIYIFDNKLYCGFWNLPTFNEDGGQEPVFISTEIEPNTKYFVTSRFDYTNYPAFPNIDALTHIGTDPYNNFEITGKFDCFVNGEHMGSSSIKSALYSHSGDINLGWNGNTCWETNTNKVVTHSTCNNEPSGVEPFDGSVFEVMMTKTVPTNSVVNNMWNYIREKWVNK